MSALCALLFGTVVSVSSAIPSETSAQSPSHGNASPVFRRSRGAPGFDFPFVTNDVPRNAHFVTVDLPEGVTIEVPRSWRRLGAAEEEMIATGVSAGLDVMGLSDRGQNRVLLNTVAVPATMFALVRVSVDPPVPRDEIDGFSEADLRGLSLQMRPLMEQMTRLGGERLLEYYGVRTDLVAGQPTVVTEYRRTGRDGPVLVQINQIFVSTRTIVVQLSYREREQAVWKPILARVRASIRLAP
jgi:hypothetical protein